MREINTNIKQIAGKELEYLVRREMERMLRFDSGASNPLPDPDTTNPRAHENATRRSVEIYFVLYLASIVTLLAIANERNIKERQLGEALAALSRPNFGAMADKIALTYQYFPMGVKPDPSLILQHDTMNVIVARGSFDQANFSIVSVIDTITGEILPAERMTLKQCSRIIRSFCLGATLNLRQPCLPCKCACNGGSTSTAGTERPCHQA